MNPSERYPPDDPREWLSRAKSSLALAKNRIADVYLEDLCFQAQQAVEKAVKAMLLKHSVEFPYVHDLSLLLSMLEETGEVIPDVVRKAEELTPYAFMTRYPGTARVVTTEEYRTAVELAVATVEWVTESL